MSEWEKIMMLEQKVDELQQEKLKLENKVNALEGQINNALTNKEYYMYLAELEKEKREKTEQKIVRLNKIFYSFLKEDYNGNISLYWGLFYIVSLN